MAEFELRPMSTGELLDRSFRLYRNHFAMFAALMALPAMFECGSELLVQLVASLGTDNRSTVVAVMATIVTVAQLYAYGLAGGLTSIAAGNLYIGRREPARVMYDRLRLHVDSLTFLFLLLGVGMIGVLIATVVVIVAAAMLSSAAVANGKAIETLAIVISFSVAATGSFLLAVRYGLSVPALLFEDLGARESLRRSARLTRGHRGRVFLVMLLMTVIIYASVIIFDGPVALVGYLMRGAGSLPFWLRVLGALASSVGSMVSLPLPMIALALMYFDIRIRTEGFDLQVMIEALRRPAPAAGMFSPHGGAVR